MSEATDTVNMDKLKAKASYVGAAVNVTQTLIKIGFGILGQSAALIADGIHSLSDLLSDLLVIIAVRLGSREADHDHPYGHRRFETIATVILGISLIGIGGGIAWSVMERMGNPEHLPVPNEISLAVAAVSILINEWLYHYTKRIAKTTRSKLLMANAWHQRSDALTSVVVLFGIGAVMLGYPLADAIAAIVVALMVAKIGLTLVLGSIKELVDTSLPLAVVTEIRSSIMAIDGVEGIHLLRSRQMGEDALIDAHIVVDPRITVSEGHMIGDIVRDDLIKRFDDVMDVLVHVDPEDDEGLFEDSKPLTRADVQGLLDEYLVEVKTAIEDFRIHYLDGQIEVEVILPFALAEDPIKRTYLTKQCKLIRTRIKKIDNVFLFFKL
ncbi:MAG: cation diffusion facilitator family transporter [Methylococcaceae bacterium]|nr:cation diffusion facilitator family transporter [Methylococcaceae bacterium]MDZ4156716.1 cation diffusion facilitator family transporter [Methylococcales bacterium]MDP2393380.1 cation diffusion facilitator family transporter [Methylococcaceae bacterium]MDP3018299.1 cation diffusion facilitator family transporter [Methylococcaceae bacterium]MDP3388517.1 cation diffusion facilitator family transporter [Methylococcaceae bacterium]